MTTQRLPSLPLDLKLKLSHKITTQAGNVERSTCSDMGIPDRLIALNESLLYL